MELARDLFTPEQAAAYLQVGRGTVYRYIHDGRLIASRMGRVYRIPRESIERLLWTNRTRSDIALRDFADDELGEFLESDKLTAEQEAIAHRAESVTLSDRHGR